MTGSGIGMTYDTVRDVLMILDQAVVHVAPDEQGAGAADIRVGDGRICPPRQEHPVRTRREAAARRPGASRPTRRSRHLTPDEKQIQSMELRGHSRITTERPAAGGLQALTGRDMDLKYAADGQTLEHAVLMGDGAIQLAGSAGPAGRQITANTIDVTLAPDGATPVGVDRARVGAC